MLATKTPVAYFQFFVGLCRWPVARRKRHIGATTIVVSVITALVNPIVAQCAEQQIPISDVTITRLEVGGGMVAVGFDPNRLADAVQQFSTPTNCALGNQSWGFVSYNSNTALSNNMTTLLTEAYIYKIPVDLIVSSNCTIGESYLQLVYVVVYKGGQ